MGPQTSPIEDKTGIAGVCRPTGINGNGMSGWAVIREEWCYCR